jgi:uncharacterized protein YkwD
MNARILLASAATVALVATGACNMITGADGVSFEDDDSANSGAGGDTSSAQNGSQAGPTSGVGGGTGGASATGVGGGTTSSGVGGQQSGPTTTSTSASTGGGEMCGGAGPGTTPLDGEELAFVTLINNHRAQNGLGPLTACISLNRTAQGHSEDMRDNNYFSHTGLNGSAPWDRACDACFDLGCGPMTAMGENIAAGNSGAQATFQQWVNSPGHNANMLSNSYTMMGIGRATGGGQYGVYWTNVFAGDDEPSCY